MSEDGHIVRDLARKASEDAVAAVLRTVDLVEDRYAQMAITTAAGVAIVEEVAAQFSAGPGGDFEKIDTRGLHATEVWFAALLLAVLRENSDLYNHMLSAPSGVSAAMASAGPELVEMTIARAKRSAKISTREEAEMRKLLAVFTNMKRNAEAARKG